ncbi:hypothetical protein QYF61_000091 [Mycteria americana]|uniref:Uncharacterized protein n=1 Tax=Mycteria americana TaxID=33587 RepID=A0AAN7N6F0_MYCAM|nr:hypothetical protein QYF61_000091 [Mycteria americana]
MHYSWQNYKRNTAESQVKLKLNTCGLCLSSGDRITLSGDEVNGYWGLGVFLNLGPNPIDEAHSITSRVVYWAGGINALDRGEPSMIPIRSLSELSTAVTKATCIKAIHQGGESGDTLLCAPIDYTTLKPLTRGAPAILKPYSIAKWDETKRDTEQNEEFGSDNTHRQLPTWAELMHGGRVLEETCSWILYHCLRTGLIFRKGKPWKWNPEHEEAVKTLIQQLKTYQSLGPVHPCNPIIAEWGFTGPSRPKRPLMFSSTAFKETEQRYSKWEKGLLSLV